MAGKKNTIISVVILVVAAAAYGGYKYWEQAKKDAQAITKVQKVENLKSEQIIKMLASGDFKQKLQARKELNKLKPAEKKAVLLKMVAEKNPAVRMMAVQGLKEFKDDTQVKNVLTGLSGDSDKDVAALAKEVLGGGK